MKKLLALILVFLFPLSVMAQTVNPDVNIGSSNPLGISGFANGDLIYYNGGVFNRLPIGTSGQILNVSSGLPAWATGGGGTGTVTSVGLQWDNVLYAAAFPNSPITGAGTLGPPSLKTQTANTAFGNFTGGTAAPGFGTVSIGAGGTGQATASAAFNALSPITLTGDLILGTGSNTAGRLGIGSSGNILTVSGGTATWAAPAAVSLTTGVSGILPLANGGTNANLTASNGGIFYSTGSAGAILSGTATANQVLLSGSSSAPGWSTATFPATTTTNQILYSSATNTVGGLATGNNGVLITSSGGAPSISSTLPTAVQGNITSLGTVASGVWNGTAIANANLANSAITIGGTATSLGGTATFSPITNSLGSNVVLNNTSNYFDGPSIAQGTSGTWWASGTVTLGDSTALATFLVKLWDGTTVIDSCTTTSAGIGQTVTASLSGYLASPAGNLRITVKDLTSTNGTIYSNNSGNSKDSTISAIRIN